jgi:hypothetical protein
VPTTKGAARISNEIKIRPSFYSDSFATREKEMGKLEDLANERGLPLAELEKLQQTLDEHAPPKNSKANSHLKMCSKTSAALEECFSKAVSSCESHQV